MSKYKNKNFRLAVVDVVLVLLLLVVSFTLGGFLYDKHCQTKGLYNIEKTDVDFIIQSPSKEQVESMGQLAHIEKVTPYIYYSPDFSVGAKNVRSNLFVVPEKNDLRYTVFSNELLKKSSAISYDNEIYISDDFAANSSLQIGDKVSADICGKNIEFTIAAIYESDYRQVGGMAMVSMSGKVEEAIQAQYKDGYRYSGAYIKSRDISATKAYLADYEPLGDLRSREEFESDELYQIYLQKRAETDYTLTTFYREAYLMDVSNRNDAKAAKEVITAFAAAIGAAIVLAIFYITRTSTYCRNEVRKDIKNKFSFKQEQAMFNKYFIINLFLILGISVLFSFVNTLIFDFGMFEINHVVAFIGCCFAVVISWVIQSITLKSKFFKK